MADEDVAFWFNQPPRAESGAFDAFARTWGGKVEYFAHRPFSRERLSTGWDAFAHPGVDMAVLGSESDALDIMRHRRDAIHVFGGYSGAVGRRLREWLHGGGRRRTVIYSERPGVYGPLGRRLARVVGLPVKGRLAWRRYGRSVDALLPLGQSGVDVFSRYGWPHEAMFPFMYNQAEQELDQRAPGPGLPARELRMVYVGRVSRYTKGTDLLVDALRKLPRKGWSLDFVGDYGDLAEVMGELLSGLPACSHLGSWPASEVTERLMDYDVVVVPSRFDGWNLVVNEGLRAGRGVIATDQTVSHELVESSGAGLVVPATVDGIAGGLRRLLDEPASVYQWADQAARFAPKFSNASSGEYLADIFRHVFHGGPRPLLPWG